MGDVPALPAPHLLSRTRGRSRRRDGPEADINAGFGGHNRLLQLFPGRFLDPKHSCRQEVLRDEQESAGQKNEVAENQEKNILGAARSDREAAAAGDSSRDRPEDDRPQEDDDERRQDDRGFINKQAGYEKGSQDELEPGKGESEKDGQVFGQDAVVDHDSGEVVGVGDLVEARVYEDSAEDEPGRELDGLSGHGLY